MAFLPQESDSEIAPSANRALHTLTLSSDVL